MLLLKSVTLFPAILMNSVSAGTNPVPLLYGTYGKDGVAISLNICVISNTKTTYASLVDFQLDAPNSYLFTYNTFIKIILYMFRALPCSSAGGLRRNCIYASSGMVTLCR